MCRHKHYNRGSSLNADFTGRIPKERLLLNDLNATEALKIDDTADCKPPVMLCKALKRLVVCLLAV